MKFAKEKASREYVEFNKLQKLTLIRDTKNVK